MRLRKNPFLNFLRQPIIWPSFIRCFSEHFEEIILDKSACIVCQPEDGVLISMSIDIAALRLARLLAERVELRGETKETIIRDG